GGAGAQAPDVRPARHPVAGVRRLHRRLRALPGRAPLPLRRAAPRRPDRLRHLRLGADEQGLAARGVAGDARTGPAEGARLMKILLVSKYLPYPQAGGGLERNPHELCLRLLKHGVTPAVMCDLSADYSPLMLRNRLARRLNPRARFPVDRGLGYPVYRGWSEDDGAAEVMQRFRPDVVIAQSAEPVPILRQFEGMGVPLMAYFH